MGEMLFCDLCGKSVAIRDALQAVMIGDTKVSDVCLNCAQAVTNDLAAKKREVEAARTIPIKATEPEPEITNKEIDKKIKEAEAEEKEEPKGVE